MIDLGDGQFRGERIGLIVGPPKPLSGDPVAQLTKADLRIREFGAHGFHHLVERHAHWGLLLVLRESHDIEQRTGRGGQVVRHPGEHRVRHRVCVDLPEKCEVGELARGAVPNLLGGVRNTECDVAAEPSAVHLVADLPGVDLREGGDEIDEALFVLSPGVLTVVTRIHRLPEHLEAFRFRVVDQRRVGRGSLPRIKDNANPAKRRREIRGEVEVHLVIRDCIDGETQPRFEDGFVVSGKNRAVLLQKRIVGHGELVERKLAGFALGAFGTVGVHARELAGGGLVGSGEFCGWNIIRSRCESGIEFFPDVPGRLVTEIHRGAGAKPHPAVVEND